MAHYHNNQLTVVGPETDDEKLHVIQNTTTNLERTRTYKPTMSDFDNKNADSYANTGAEPAKSDNVRYVDASHGALASEFSRHGYAFGGEHFAPYDAYNGGDTAFTDYPPLHDVYSGGDGNYDQFYDASLSLYSAPPGNDMYPFTSFAYDVPTAIPEVQEGKPTLTVEEGSGSTEVEDEVKVEEGVEHTVSYTPESESEGDSSGYEERRPSKVLKTNKDGVPRKPRQPRAKLLKWDDNDWKNVALGLVWACGENGIQIPFDQASQVVSESCTAGALQQALLKLRCKQIAEGHQVPQLRMAWTRKNKKSGSIMSSANSPKATLQETVMPYRPAPVLYGTFLSVVLPLASSNRLASDQRGVPFVCAHRRQQSVDYGRLAPRTPLQAARELECPGAPRKRKRVSFSDCDTIIPRYHYPQRDNDEDEDGQGGSNQNVFGAPVGGNFGGPLPPASSA
ncbi:hypothetical protein CC86DRAFT_468755 [Ophiobolus disseminans]|uniref:Uncharacterized protein n=1 Tax=Ophiobolus disseminans TaxID=1469910 RepID=A0A6A6ZTS1_9PLEO|nr:hypothetical protein CC86DRAFT_468755 [Ophiobolus disseminans]